MKIIYYILTAILIGAALSHTSCISSEETNYFQNIKTGYSPVPFKEYKLKTGDLITCSITTEDAEFLLEFNSLLNSSQNAGKIFTIYENGTIIIPFFGDVKIDGLTLQKAESKIQTKLRESITDAQVKVALASNTFIIYANERKGVFTVYKENMTIFQALAISGQTTEHMDLTSVTVARINNRKETEIRKFDLRTQDIIESEFYYIQPNDIIYFRTNKNSFYNITSLGAFFNTIQSTMNFVISILLVQTQIK